MQIGVGLLNIVAVLLDAMAETTHVVVGMIANAMAFADYTLVEFGIFTDVIAHHEERGFHSIFGQYVEDVWRGFGYGPIVEGQID